MNDARRLPGRLFPLVVIAAAVSLSACDGGGGSGGASGGVSRDAAVDEGEVTVVQGTEIVGGISVPDGSYTARQVITISNNDGGATSANVALTTAVGDIEASGSSDGYVVTVTLEAKRDNEADARAALASMHVEHSDKLGDGVLSLAAEVVFGNNPNNQSGTIVAQLPTALAYALKPSSNSGDLSINDLHGSSLEADTDNGGVTATGVWSGASLTSDNGDLSFSGDSGDLFADTSNGTVTVVLACKQDADVSLMTANGTIDAQVDSTVAGVGFDLLADTDLGTASVDVAGTDPVGAQSETHAHYRSTSYSSAPIQVNLDAQSSTGDVTVHESAL